MEFQRERVFTALNADELRAGDKVIVGDVLANIKENVKQGKFIRLLYRVEDECNSCRFVIKDDDYDLNGETINFALAYLVERKENCGNCGDEECPDAGEDCKFLRCADWKPILIRAEKHYRPFANTEELIKVWNKKFYFDFKPSHDPLTMPFIWVHRDDTYEECLIVTFDNDSVYLGHRSVSLHELWEHFTFLDGSVCGVEE